ncbi:MULTISPECIES: hypothetical protein [Enterococcus]|uniref:Uncharacterized protein n=1 Tax=Enterococcus malodoratus ATCC 43197 TaxID=1158601 RepID=R2PEA4_9ENTE|nr:MULTISPECIES: hypothetical protein [Enterococcus]BBM17974.1 hypothetical protein G15_1638 [Enterococcus avium]EOH82697.1 hypothetical protein UAI_00092 [Enterococcus malodoratus ATCC 43197]EOT70513.1 hypothetical protein I585_00024 [Enterococcus malodoratus ATCC 43197]OJG64546.1 hypothetical protein RV07_GL004248 [Enterococcus malodoratus]SET05406.1 hypothetical protein SAMN04487821_105171 [Enterococcus malodoratus]
MIAFEEKLQEFPRELRQAWSIGFVFMYNGKTFHHFPARQWTDAQIKEYFQNNYDSPSIIIAHPDLKLKELKVEKYPDWIVVIPY